MKIRILLASAVVLAACAAAGCSASLGITSTPASVTASPAALTGAAAAAASECTRFTAIDKPITDATDGDTGTDAEPAVEAGGTSWEHQLEDAATAGKGFPASSRAAVVSRDMSYAAVGIAAAAVADDTGNGPGFATAWETASDDLTDASYTCAGRDAPPATMPVITAAPSTAPPAAQTVTYIVTGTPGADITYGPAGSGTAGQVPMRVTQPLATPSYYAITGQLQGSGTITCEILVDGQVIARGTAAGGYNIAQCEISQDILTGDWESDN